jgi:diguanylate cyclase (GGDEF)-like protein
VGIESLAPVVEGDWRALIRECARALRRAETWLPHRNPFVVFGMLWGLPVPFTTLGVECATRGLGYTWSNLVAVLIDSPWQWLFLAHPFVFGVMFGVVGTVARERAAKVEDLLEQLRTSADTDGLTGLLNHRAFYTRLREELARAERAATELTLLLLDIDHFKRLNDEHGHVAGDRVLAALARRLLEGVRPYDVVARYGGEEFAVILAGLDAKAGVATAERLRLSVAARPFAIGDHVHVSITVSLGAVVRNEGADAEALVKLVDERLYASKRTGRNRTTAPPGVPAGVPVEGAGE